MIGKLRGIVDSINNGTVILFDGGTGYIVFASGRTLGALAPGDTVTLFIDTHVREDHIHLIGFLEESEQQWFRLLSTVKGVSTKIALAILSVVSTAQLTTALAAQDKAALTQVSGVGPKLADRILTELKDKGSTLPTCMPTSLANSPVHDASQVTVSDAVSALVNLGYSRSDAYITVAKAASHAPEASAEELIRFSLKELAV